jgi:hypothetical protein
MDLYKVVAQPIPEHQDLFLVIEKTVDEIGIIHSENKSIVRFQPTFNNAAEIKSFIETNDWSFFKLTNGGLCDLEKTCQ